MKNQASTTELNQIVSGLLWQDAFVVGNGVNAVTGQVQGSAMRSSELTKPDTKTTTTDFQFIEDQQSLQNQISASVNAAYSIGSVDVKGSLSYLGQISTSRTSVTLMAKADVLYEEYSMLSKEELTDESAILIRENPDKFRDKHGDFFVAGEQLGSSFYAIYQCTSQDEKSMNDFKISISGKKSDVFSADGTAEFMSIATEHQVNVSVHITMAGVDANVSPSSDPTEVPELFQWFLQNEKGTARFAYLKHYDTIDSNYSRVVDVAPSTFLAIKNLLNVYWDVYALYSNCPVNYKSSFSTPFTNLVNKMSVYQSVLASDDNTRNDLVNESYTLQGQLTQVFDRYDFYQDVKQLQTTEPDPNVEIDDSEATDVWSYGISESTNASIIIQKMNQNYTAEGSFLATQDHTFNFPEDRKKLIVGWQVVANWHDGTDGCWDKSTSPYIILNDNAQIYIASENSRGLNWDVNIFYVDAVDFQFS